MAKKILVAFDDSDNAMRAVQYVAETHKTDNKVTLFSVIPDTADICRMDSKELTPYFKSQKAAFCTLEDKKKELLGQAMEKAKKVLTDAGFDANNIAGKMTVKKNGIARDIVAEANSGYDVVVIGRRGLSGIKELFLGSISQKVLNLAKEASICIIN
jgi:nucleotide-binding universal stress UspA family protein